MRVGYLITGRLKSTRLPKKLLLEIKGKPIISHMIDRLKQSKAIDEIVICTSDNEQDKPLLDIAQKNNIKVFAGDADDVLKRLLDAAKNFNLDYILNITADCPFVDPYYADKIVKAYTETSADLIRQFDLPHGVFSYGIKVEALEKVVEIKDSSDTEVWGRYFVDTGIFNVVDLDVDNKKHIRPGLRMTLDYPEDFEFFRTIFDELYKENQIFSLDEILDLLDRKPEIIDINKHCSNQFKKRFISQSVPKLKKISQVKTALILGAGSIGQRHIRNLSRIGIEDIVALRSRKGHYKELPKELGVVEVDNWKDAFGKKPDIAIISNPSSMHVETALKACDFVKGIFIEKPVSNSLENCDHLIETIRSKRITPFVGFNLMFHPLIKKLIDFYNNNDLGEVVNFQCQVGQWLPDWHPYEDYKQAYYANKSLGGGVILTLIHEIQLAIELCGMPISVYGEITNYDKLELNEDVDVCADLMIRHQTNVVSQVHLDYIQRPSHRSGLVTFENGWASYDFNSMELKVQLKGESVKVLWSDKKYDFNNAYIDQMIKFVNFVEEGRLKHSYDVNSALESLKVADAFFKSAKLKKRVGILRDERFSF